MQEYNQHNIIGKSFGRIALAAVYHGLRLVWMAVRSCFGSGQWLDDKPWLDDEAWKD